MKRSFHILAIGIMIGAGLAMSIVVFAGKKVVSDAPLTHPVKATLYRFRLQPENMKIYQEWVQWHHDAYRPMIKTLERERMYFESVFRDTVREPEVIYWLAIEGEGGENSSTSDMEIDKKHNEYMKQIMVKGSRSILKTEFTLMPEFIEQGIADHQQAKRKP